MASLPALQGSRLHQRTGSTDLCVVLHGHGMMASEMEEWLLQFFADEFPRLDVVFLQAPTRWNAAASRFLPSWLAYQQEFDGKQEDSIDTDALLRTLADLERAVQHLNNVSRAYRGTICLGLTRAPLSRKAGARERGGVHGVGDGGAHAAPRGVESGGLSS